MRLRFTKMQGAGNDFVVLDATRAPIELTVAQVQRLGDRRLGVGGDQILVVEASDTPGVDFRYRIFNGFSGDEVEHCGNGARCFVRFVREHGLTDKTRICVETVNNRLELQWRPDGRVTVDMNLPVFDLARVPFDATGLVPHEINGFALWPLDVAGQRVEAAVLSMGNPHAVVRVDDIDAAPVALLGPALEGHPRFKRRVNAGFMQIQSRRQAALRVYERGAGETLACGTGSAAVTVAGVLTGRTGHALLNHLAGGDLEMQWDGVGEVFMTGPAVEVFSGEYHPS